MPPAATRPSGRHRFLAALSVLAVLLLGFFALGRLPTDLPPSRDAPRLRVQVSVPGVSAPVIEEKITRRLEQALAGVTGVAAVESATASGSAVIDLPLKHRRGADAAQQDVTARLERAKSSLPAAIEPPAVSIIDASSIAAEFAMISRERDLLALRDWAEGEFAKRLRELSGVAAVDIEGGAVREILVMPDQRRLAGFGLSFGDVLQAIRKGPGADVRVRAPSAKGRGRRETMQSGNAAAVAAMPVILPGGESVRLSEVARVTLGEEMKPGRFRFDGAEAIRVTVLKQSRAAMSEVVESIQAHIEWMRANRLIPEGIEIHPVSRRLDEARQSLRQIAFALIGGVSLALLAAHFLLGRGRRTLILGVIITASVQAVFVAMALSRLALDVMTLGGLALGAGLLGGGALLMFENTARPAQAGAAAVNPVIAAAMAMPAALLPVLFVGNATGALFRKFVFVFCAAWLISAVLALLLVPAFDARVRRQQEQGNTAVRHAIARARRSYGSLLHRVLRHPFAALAVAVVLAGAMMAAPFLKRQELLPPSDRHVEEIAWRIQGPDAGRLSALGDDIVQRLRAVPDLREVKHSAQAFHEELVLRMDEARAQELGVDITEAGRAFAIALAGIPAGSFRDAEHRYDIRMLLPPGESGSTAWGRILLLGELEDRTAVHLRDVATVERVTVPAQIRRHDGMPLIEVTALPAGGSSPIQALTHVREVLGNFKLPAGYRLSYEGSGKATEASRSQGLTLLGLALLFLFVAQVLLHRSLRVALLVASTAFSALAGAGAAVLLFDLSLSPPVWLGALILIGITAGYATVPAMHGLAQGEQGLSLEKKIVQAAKHRFRPLLAITLIAEVAMLSLLFVNGRTVILHPLVVTVATGLLFSLMANLLLAPLLYYLAARTEQSPVKLCL